MSTRAFPKFTDGFYGTPRRISTSPRRRPFAARGDLDTMLYTSTYLVAPGAWSPTARGTEDPDNPGFYLLEETEPDAPADSTAPAAFTRTYGNVPAAHARGASLNYTRPVVPGSGQYRAYGSETTGNAGLFYQPDTALSRFQAYSRRAVATDPGVANAPTGGTYTLTFGADTTGSLAYNAIASTVKTALDGLTSIANYGGLATLTGNYNDAAGFVATFADYATGTLDTSGLALTTDGVLSSSVTPSDHGRVQAVALQVSTGAIAPAFALDASSLTTTTGAVISASFGAGASGTVSIAIAGIDSATPSVDTSSITQCTASLVGSLTQASLGGGAYAAKLTLDIVGSGSLAGQPAPGGSFTLTAFGETTAAINIGSIANGDIAAFNAAVLAALNALTNLPARGTLGINTAYFIRTGGGAGVSRLELHSEITIAPRITGGTYTLDAFGETTAAIAYNADGTAIAAALNALAGVQARGNIALTSTGSGIFGWNGTTGFAFNYAFTSVFTGGSFTLTLFGQTTAAIGYNASGATIESALNALTNVAARGGCVVSGAGLSSDHRLISFSATFADVPAISGASSLTGTPSAVTVTPVAGTRGRQQNIKLTAAQVTRLLTTTNPHGLVAGDAIYVKMGSTYYFVRTDWEYVSPTQISLNPSVEPWSTNTTIGEIGKFQGDYEPGPADHRGKIESAFYWPGVSEGIDTYDDIPEAAEAISDVRYLDAIVNGDSYVSYAAGGLDFWQEPIYQRDTTYLRPYRNAG